jgi:hypothetical protein
LTADEYEGNKLNWTPKCKLYFYEESKSYMVINHPRKQTRTINDKPTIPHMQYAAEFFFD